MHGFSGVEQIGERERVKLLCIKSSWSIGCSYSREVVVIGVGTGVGVEEQ